MPGYKMIPGVFYNIMIINNFEMCSKSKGSKARAYNQNPVITQQYRLLG